MITLACPQMIYFVASALDRYGADDGFDALPAAASSALARPQQHDAVLLPLPGAACWPAFYLVWRIVNSRFGLVIQGARSNERRMHAIGFPTYRYKLLCFVIAGTMCGLAGALLANHPTSSARR